MLLLFVANGITLIVLVNIGRRLEPAANQSANTYSALNFASYLLAGWIHSFSRVSIRSFWEDIRSSAINAGGAWEGLESFPWEEAGRSYYSSSDEEQKGDDDGIIYVILVY